MRETLELKVEPRTKLGKGPTYRTRRQGLIPGPPKQKRRSHRPGLGRWSGACATSGAYFFFFFFFDFLKPTLPALGS